MECACIRGDNYHAHVEAIDSYNLIYTDMSDWMDKTDSENYCDPEEYDVELLKPTSSEPTTLTLKVGSTNKIESDSKLKDGIYCFKVSSCGEVYERFKAIFPSMQCCIDKAYISDVDVEKIKEVEKYLKRASINAELRNEQTANSNLSIAKKLLENIKCDCDC